MESLHPKFPNIKSVVVVDGACDGVCESMLAAVLTPTVVCICAIGQSGPYAKNPH